MRIFLLSISLFAVTMTLAYNYRESEKTRAIGEALQDLNMVQRLRGQQKFEAWYFYTLLERNRTPVNVQFERFYNSHFFDKQPPIRNEAEVAKGWGNHQTLLQLRDDLEEAKSNFNKITLDPDEPQNLEPVLTWVTNILDITTNFQDLNNEFNQYLSQNLAKNLRINIFINLVMLVFIGACWFLIYYNRQKELLNNSLALNEKLSHQHQDLQVTQRVMTSVMEDLKIEKVNALTTAINNQQLATIVEQSSEAILKLDTEGGITSVNPAALTMLQIPLKNLLNQDFSGLFGDQNETAIQSSIDQVKSHLARAEIQLETSIPPNQGDLAIYEIHFSPLQNREKSLTGISVFIRDITSMIQYQKQLSSINSRLQEKNREMEQFIYTISHDLKSPLVTISAFAKRLQTSLQDRYNDKEKHQLERIQINVAHMETLLNELLNLSRVIRQSIEKQWLDTEKVVNKVLNTLESSIKESDTTISITTPLEPIYANEHQFYQCIQNLVSNSIKYKKPDNKLIISIQSKKHLFWSEFVIMDNGLGIDPKYHQQIFNIFERLDVGEGSGVGLAIVKTIMEKHLGQVVLNSNSGEGSTFKLLFPNPNNTINSKPSKSAVG